MYHNDVMGASLDNHITGHYGEDQFPIWECGTINCPDYEDCIYDRDTDSCPAFDNSDDEMERNFDLSHYE